MADAEDVKAEEAKAAEAAAEATDETLDEEAAAPSPTATPAPAPDPWDSVKQKYKPEDLDRLFKESERAADRERNAQEALRAAQERNSEAKKIALENKAHSELMERALKGFAMLDPESPIAKVLRNAGVDGEDSPSHGAGQLPASVAQTIEQLQKAVEQHGEVISQQQFTRAVENVDGLSRRLFKSLDLEGVVGEEKFVAKTRQRVLADPKVRSSTDASDIERRIAEIAKEYAAEVEEIGTAWKNRWKERRKSEKNSAAPTGKGAGTSSGQPGKPVPHFDGTDWEGYLARMEKVAASQ